MRKTIYLAFLLIGCTNKPVQQQMGMGCPAPTGAGVKHSAYIKADQTWTAAESPHHVTQAISVLGATLTVEPCATVVIDEGVTITVGENAGAPAKLVALGNPDPNDLRPITFKSSDDAKFWGTLSIYPTGSADLSAVVLQRAGNPLVAQNFGGALQLFGSVRAHGLLIDEAAGFGINLQRTGSFTADSDDVTVQNSGKVPSKAAIDTRYPIFVHTPAVQTIPPGSYTGNAKDEILVEGANSFDGNETFRDRGVPYRIRTTYTQLPAAVGGLNTLTIEPGVTIKLLGTDTAFNLGGSNGHNVQLIAAGTAAKPIVFTSAADTPAAGDWGGIEWSGAPSTGNVMTFVTIEYGGGTSLVGNYGCGDRKNDALLPILNWQPAEAFIQNCTFSNSAFGGIVSGWHGPQGDPDLHTGNTFTNIANNCAVSVPTPVSGPCPSNGIVPDCY